MSVEKEERDDDKKEEQTSAAKRVVKYNEKINVPEQTEVEEAETNENAEPENLADDSEIERRKGNY